MRTEHLIPDKAISLFVKNILVFEETDESQKTFLPFFADGYPGIMFQKSKHGSLVIPHNKLMPDFFLYGQTIKPIELVLNGTFTLVVFQLYPFVLESFFDVDPKELNDNCYDLSQISNQSVQVIIRQLKSLTEKEKAIKVIAEFLYDTFQLRKASLDDTIREAIQLILFHKGQFNISKLATALNITRRTLERRFTAEVGVSPKQFSKIIQFQLSLEQLTVKDYTKLTDIVYSNGFVDQSHFIKVFKAFTGKTPKKFEYTLT